MMFLKEAVNALLSGDGSFGAQGHGFIREALIWASDNVPVCKSIVCTGKMSLFQCHKKRAQGAATNVNI